MTWSPGSADEDPDRSINLIRRTVVLVFVGFFVLAPAIGVFGHRHPSEPAKWFLFCGSLVFLALAWRYLVTPRVTSGLRPRWIPIGLVLGLGIALFVVGQENYVVVLAIAAAACGRYGGTSRPALIGATVCAAAGFTVAVRTHAGFGNSAALIAAAPMAAFFAYTAARRLETVSALRRTRAELARAAVAEERLRIARDLHDLLGHSLSLITLKAELAGRVIGTDPGRAAQEIGELESVARRSLSDVREAVAGFRQPDLDGELAAARSLLDAAGIAATISSVPAGSLPQTVDAALAWAVREGATNVVRHSRATSACIRVAVGTTDATAEISDDGPAASGPDSVAAADFGALPDGQRGSVALAPARPGPPGSGLAGLAERIRSLGGELAAGTVEPQGFLLRVVVPLTSQA